MEDGGKQLEFLRACFPSINAATVRNSLEMAGGDLEIASSHLLALAHDCPRPSSTSSSSTSGPTVPVVDVDSLLAVLVDEFPQMECQLEELQSILTACDNDLLAARELLLRDSSVESRSVGGKKPRQQRVHRRQLLPVPIQLTPSPAANDDDGISTPTVSISNSRLADPGTGESHRQKAGEYAQLRNDNFARASSSYKRADFGPAIAAHYASQGHLYGERMSRSNQRAVEAFVQENNTRDMVEAECTLDLHYLHVQEALTVLHEQIQAWQRMGKRKAVVITGRGRYMQNIDGLIFKNVEKYLLRNGYAFEYGVGAFHVTLKRR